MTYANVISHGFRLSPQQKQIWLSQQAFPGQPFRAIGVFDVAGSLDSKRLHESMIHVIERHEILRTTFARPAGIKIPFQIVSEDTSFFWQSLDLKSLDEGRQRERIAALIAAERKEPLTLEAGPVLRCQIVELSDDRSVLLLSLPATSADSVTLTNLMREVCQSYQSNEESAAEVVQYADFAEWQNQMLESTDERTLASKAYWNAAAADSAPVLPLEKRSRESMAAESELVTFAAGEELLNQLAVVAANSGATLSDLLFLSWQILISRLSGRREFTIYRRCHGRKLEDLQAALGPFDRYLPVSCKLEDGRLARQLALVTERLRQTEETQEYAEAGDAGLLAGNAIGFEFEERSKCATESLSVSPVELFVFSNPFKLKLSCILSEKQLTLQLQYDRTTLDRETCERFTGYLRRVLEAVAAMSGAKPSVESIDLLADDEKRKLLVEINETSRSYTHDKCAHELFEAQVAKTPAALAVVCGDRQLTYEQLNTRANQLAHLLREYGVGPNSCVGMCVSRSVEAIVALLGILKAGAAYVPLDPEHPQARLTIQLEKARATVCVTNVAALAESLRAHTKVIDFSRDAEVLGNQPHDNLPAAVSSEALAYVIYTSGSTGIPKGVMVRHRNLVNYAEFMLQRLQVDQLLRFALASAINADLGNTCIFPALFSGGCLHILTREVTLESRLFTDYVSRHAIDVLKIAPSHLQALLSDTERKEMLPAKYLILGGEAFSRQLLDSILTTAHSCKIINHYGPTETTVGSLTFDVTEQELPDVARTVPIGGPIANTRVYVLDQDMRPAPAGVAGELYIGGAGVAVGYLGDPDLTATKFVPDLFSAIPGDRLYRTGDLVRILPSGDIEFLGRSDFQVKVRGYRVELGEIEAVLCEHPLVSHAVVILRNDKGQERFVVYVMSARLRPANTDEIRQYLRERLPDYMAPAAIVVLRSFPTTANGKMDRLALPDPDEAKSKDRVMVAPQTTTERELARIWSGLLNVEELSVHDNFFSLGGHSLIATQVISRIHKVFNKNIPLRTIFDAPTIAKLASAIEAASSPDVVDLQTELAALESLSDEEAERLLREAEETNLGHVN